MLRQPRREKTISFRPPVLEHERLLQLKSTFPDPTWPEVFHWLLELPGVGAAIAKRLENTPALWEQEPDAEVAPGPTPQRPERNSVRADLGYVD